MYLLLTCVESLITDINHLIIPRRFYTDWFTVISNGNNSQTKQRAQADNSHNPTTTKGCEWKCYGCTSQGTTKHSPLPTAHKVNCENTSEVLQSVKHDNLRWLSGGWYLGSLVEKQIVSLEVPQPIEEKLTKVDSPCVKSTPCYGNSNSETSANDEQLHSSTGNGLKWSLVNHDRLPSAKVYTHIGLKLYQTDIACEWYRGKIVQGNVHPRSWGTAQKGLSDSILGWVHSPRILLQGIGIVEVQDQIPTVLSTCKTGKCGHCNLTSTSHKRLQL